MWCILICGSVPKCKERSWLCYFPSWISVRVTLPADWLIATSSLIELETVSMAPRPPTIQVWLPVLPVSLQLALFYTAIFTVIGVYLPFWPVWLKAQGLNDSELGLVIGVSMGARVVANPLVAHLVDRSGQRTNLMRWLAVSSVILCSLFAVIDGFWPMLLLSTVWVGVFTALMPLGENLALLIAYTRRLDYGRIRLWGSLSFVVMSMASGVLLTNHPPAILLALLIVGMVLTVIACLLLQDLPPSSHERLHSVAFQLVMGDSRYWLFLAAASLVSASHNLYYSFATLHWQRAGISSAVIGGLWAEAVVAEIFLFAFSNHVVTWLGPTGLLMLGGGVAMIRWIVLGATTHLMVLVAVQILHAFTFGAIHLGAMHFLTRAVLPEASARAQAVYGSVSMGAAVGLATMVAGPLYQSLEGQAFHVSAGLAALGSLLAVFLHRRWRGGLLGS